ncbi:MAG: hypothetical protein H7336_00430 [Bacteriovorax sp.]|nr:hypothetical protein [Bacteriovorax sp.]
MKKYLTVTFLLLSLNAFAGTLPTTKADYCSRFQDTSVLSTYSTETSNLMSFKNQGGLFNGGVCWWHSRFQRNILYLSIFRPELNKPTASEVRALIKEIRAGESVVMIPGFANFAEFSTTYSKEILAELESWQLYDGVILGSWIDGLKGDTKVRSEELQKMMATTFKYVEVNKKIAYQKLQIKGITSHAWLIVGMIPGPNGFEIGLIDSNNPRMSENYSYKIGDVSFHEKSYGNFVPYLEFTREEERLISAGKSFCGVKGVNDSDPKDWAQGYEQDLAEAKSHLN